MFGFLADVVIRRGWLIVLGWAVVAVALYRTAPAWERVTKDDNVRFFPAGYPSVVGQELLERGFPREASSSQVVVIAERHDGHLTSADFAFVDGLVQTLNELREDEPAIKKLDTYRTPVVGPRLVGMAREGKGQAVLTLIHLNGTYLAKATRLGVNRILDVVSRIENPGQGPKISRPPTPALKDLEEALKNAPRPPKGLILALTGSAVVGHDMNEASIRSVDNTTHMTIVLVVIILLVVYRSPLLALIPLLTIALSAWVALKTIAVLTKLPGLNIQVIDITRVFVIVVLFGAGTDYCLFLIARYREELARGRDRRDSLREAITQVGGALVASAGTVIVGLGMLWFSTFAKIQYTGPAIALSLSIALLAALTLAPVLLHWLRAAVFWPFQQPHHTQGTDAEQEGLEQIPLAGFWVKVADLVVKHPLIILIVCVLALTPFAVIGAGTRSNYSQLADLSEKQTSVKGANLVKNYFELGELSPSTILIEHRKLDFLSQEGRDRIEVLSRRLAKIDEVAEVRSISRPLGQPPIPESEKSFLQRALERTLRVTGAVDSRYVDLNPADKNDKNHITRLDVVFHSDPFSDTSLRALEAVYDTLEAAIHPDQPLYGATDFGLAGATSAINDLRKVTTNDERWMYILVTIGVYVVLVFLIRRPALCLYLIGTVVLGYLASLGVTELVFKALHHGPDAWVGLDWKVSFFLFVILVAVGEDYNIFLMSRVIEEERKHGVIEGTRRAVAHTGGIISSCGLIMAGTFGSMLTGSLTALRELGFALGLGVLLDTFLVRPVLVPAFVILVERYLQSAPPKPPAAPPQKKQRATTSTATLE